MAKNKVNGVLAVERALRILDVFQEGDRSLTLAELSRRTGFYKSTLLRLAASLEAYGFLRRLNDGSFMLGPSLMRLGQLYRSAFNLEIFVRPVLQRLVSETGESASLHVRQDNSRICLYRVDSRHAIRDHVREGDRLPLDRGAAGHVLLAFSEQGPRYNTIRQRLVVSSYGERDSETAALAVPIFAADDQLVGAISLSGPLTRFDPVKAEHMTGSLLAASRDLTVALGGSTAPFDAVLAQVVAENA